MRGQQGRIEVEYLSISNLLRCPEANMSLLNMRILYLEPVIDKDDPVGFGKT